jgi:hypothetical protein
MHTLLAKVSGGNNLRKISSENHACSANLKFILLREIKYLNTIYTTDIFLCNITQNFIHQQSILKLIIFALVKHIAY